MSQISPSYVTGLEKYINELRNQVSSLKAELREICAAIDDPACDLTLTAVECIKKFKGENEWQPIETAPTDGTAILVCHDGGVWIAKHKAVYQSGYKPDNPWFCLMLNKDHIPSRKRKGYPTHWMPLPQPPAMAQGDKP